MCGRRRDQKRRETETERVREGWVDDSIREPHEAMKGGVGDKGGGDEVTGWVEESVGDDGREGGGGERE